MRFWYIIDNPRDSICWEVNPKLWEQFKAECYRVTGTHPKQDKIYTEQYVVQLLDFGFEETLRPANLEISIEP